MAKYIDVKKIPYYLVGSDDTNTKAEGRRVAFKNEIDKMPAADVQEVKRGAWVHDEFDMLCCSECKEELAFEAITTYCPYCGAKMEGKDGESGNGQIQ